MFRGVRCREGGFGCEATGWVEDGSGGDLPVGCEYGGPRFVPAGVGDGGARKRNGWGGEECFDLCKSFSLLIRCSSAY